MMTKRSLGVIAVSAVVSVSLAVAVVLGDYCWKKENRQPCAMYTYSGGEHDGPFHRIGCVVWRTGNDDLFYAAVIGYTDFEPTIPSFEYKHSYDIQAGGELFIDGKRIDYSPKKRLLALNPFGRMQEIVLSNSESQVVVSADGEQIWRKVILKRLYRFNGDEKNGKRVGHWVCSDSAGKKAYEGEYVDGNRDGKWVYFYPSGTTRAEIHYANGKRHGKWSYFSEDGELTDFLTWNNNTPVEHPASQVGLGHSEVRVPDGSRRETFSSP